MPTYEYECAKCGDRFEIFQKMTDEPVEACPKCGARPQRLIGLGGGIIFKGPGFYATDYKNAKAKDDKKVCPDAKSDKCKSCPLDNKKAD